MFNHVSEMKKKKKTIIVAVFFRNILEKKYFFKSVKHKNDMIYNNYNLEVRIKYIIIEKNATIFGV